MSSQTTPGGNLYFTTPEELTQPTADQQRAINRDARDRELKAEVTEAKSLAQQAKGTLSRVESQAVKAHDDAASAERLIGSAQAIANDLVPRMAHLETMGGLAPGEVTDAQTANLIAQTNTLTRESLTGALVPTIEERIVFVSARGDDNNDGLTLKGAKRTVAAAVDSINGVGLVQLPRGTVDLGQSIQAGRGLHIRGAGYGLSTIDCSTIDMAITSATPGVRSYQYSISDVTLSGPGKGTDTVGIDLDSVSEAALTNVVVSGFGTGIRVHSSINGGSVYNRLTNVKAQSCDIGISIEGSGSNGSVLNACRANVCDVGIYIEDSNNTTIIAPQIEMCEVGLKIHASSGAASDLNHVIAPRFERNDLAWDIGELVRYTTISDPKTFGTYTYSDLGQDTAHTGAKGSHPNWMSSTRSAADGSWRHVRTAHGGSENPAFVVRDDNRVAGTPVTFLAETERSTGYFYRGTRNGETYWDVDAHGNMRSLKGGYTELSTRSTAAPAPTSGKVRLYATQDSNGKTILWARFASGSPVRIVEEP